MREGEAFVNQSKEMVREMSGKMIGMYAQVREIANNRVMRGRMGDEQGTEKFGEREGGERGRGGRGRREKRGRMERNEWNGTSDVGGWSRGEVKKRRGEEISHPIVHPHSRGKLETCEG